MVMDLMIQNVDYARIGLIRIDISNKLITFGSDRKIGGKRSCLKRIRGSKTREEGLWK